MAEDSTPKVAKTDYASNSAKSKQEPTTSKARPEIQQIVAGTVRKKSVGAKFREAFTGDSAESVGMYVLTDIIIPRVKDLLFDIINGGSERALFGTSSRSSRSRSQRSEKMDYRGISSSKREERRERDISDTGRRNHNFDEILIPTRGEAEQVRDTLIALIDEYDVATVADLYGAVGISTDHTDLKFGWSDLSESRITPARGGGYILEMPRAEVL